MQKFYISNSNTQIWFHMMILETFLRYFQKCFKNVIRNNFLFNSISSTLFSLQYLRDFYQSSLIECTLHLAKFSETFKNFVGFRTIVLRTLTLKRPFENFEHDQKMTLTSRKCKFTAYFIWLYGFDNDLQIYINILWGPFQLL